MKYKRSLLTAAVITPVLVAFNMPGASIEFGVSEGATVKKTFANVVEIALDDMSMTMNGEEPPMMPEMDMTVTTTYDVVVEDEYLALMDGAPKKLKRTYESITTETAVAMEIDMMGNVQNNDVSIPSSSELEGETVLFTWNGESSEYDASFPDDEGDKELLENLSEDLDLRSLLPDGEVSEGDEWTIDAASLAAVLAPGGDLKLVPEDVEGMDMGGMDMGGNMGSMSDWFNEGLTGKVTGTFVEMVKEGDDSLAKIKVVVKIENAVDLTEMIQEAMENAEMPPEAEGMEMDIDHMDLEIEFEAEGELLWNLAAGHAQSLELSGDFAMVMDMGMAMSIPGMGEMEMEQTIEMSGTMKSTASFE